MRWMSERTNSSSCRTQHGGFLHVERENLRRESLESTSIALLGLEVGECQLQSITARQNFIWESKLLVGLVLRSHPGPDSFIQQNVLGVEGLELGVFSSP
jgi:hypothetical protein